MNNSMLRVCIHMVSSLDGIIAKPDNSIEWFNTEDHYEDGLGTEGLDIAAAKIDCYVMGSKTYELASKLEKDYGWPYGSTPTLVLSGRPISVQQPAVELFGGNPVELLQLCQARNYRNVWVVGGPALCTSFLKMNLVKEIRVVILPILLGTGRRFFEEFSGDRPLHLISTQAYRNGMLELIYEIKEPVQTIN